MNTLLQLLMVTTLIALFMLFRFFVDRLTLRSRMGHGALASDCEHTGCMRSCDNESEIQNRSEQTL